MISGAQLLAGYLDEEFKNYLLRDLEHGFRIGFSWQACELRSCQGNLSLAQDRPELVSRCTQEELVRGRVFELSDAEACELQVHCSPFGVILKKSNLTKWRLIRDLSSPVGKAVNDGGIVKSFSYVSVDDNT